MIVTFFVIGCFVTLTGMYQFDAQRLMWAKLSAIPVLLIGIGMMAAAIMWSAP